MLRKLAHIFSWVFQPLLMPTIAAALFLQLPFYTFKLMPIELKWYVITCNALFTILLPVLMIFLLLRNNMIETLELKKREDRKYPIIFTIAFHIANYYFLSRAHLPGPYMFFLLAGLFSLILTLVVTNYWKVSLHMTGVGGLIGGFLALSLIWPVDLRLLLFFMFLIAGITGTSRLLLNVHTSAQVAVGFFVGFIPQLSLILIAQ
jgi:membrane-associated phospholipid phosphatase